MKSKWKNPVIKRVISFMLVFAMCLTLVPDLAMAAAPQSITTAAEFAAMTADGSYRLDQDITLTTPYANDFSGTFDGNGHTVTLDITGTGNYTGMFKSLTGGAVVKNLITAGKVDGGSRRYTAAIAGSADTDNGDITIENCRNEASVSGSRGVAGVVSYMSSSSNTLTIRNCANTGTITGSGVQTGGIAGNLEGTSVIESCYNSGSIVGFNNYAGILGRGVGAAVKNSYTSGSIITYEGSTNVGYAIIGSSKSGGNCTVENSYALEGSGDALNYAKGVTADAASAYKSQSDMQSEAFAALLGSAFQYNEGAYPTLTWEVPAVEVPSAKVPFSLNPESAVLKINGESYTGSGTLTFTEAGEYPYTIEQTGYVSQSGTVTVTEADGEFTADPAEITATLEKDASVWAVLTVTLSPEDAVFTLMDGENAVAPESNGTYSILKNRDYNYTASKDGYVEENGVINIAEDTTKTITLAEAEAPAFPSHVFDGLLGKATVTYDHNSSYTGVTGEEFVDDETTGALKSNSQGMSSSQVTIVIDIAASIGNAELSFDYKVDGEGSYTIYDGLSINGGSKIGTTSDFVSYKMSVKGGDKVTIAYIKDSYGDKGEDCIWVKNFQMNALYNLTLTSSVSDADIVLKNAAGDTVSGSNGVYQVQPGTYSYTVSKFGYKTESGTITVTDSDVSKEISLTEVAKQQVTFKTTLPEGVSADSTYTIMFGDYKAAEGTGTSYMLPEGEYTYTVSNPYCDTVSGSFTLGAAQEIPVTMVRKLVFDDFFSALSDRITAADDSASPFTAVKSEDGNYLQSSNTKSYTTSTMKITASKPTEFSFKYWVSESGSEYSSSNYGMIVSLNGTQLTRVEEISTAWTDYTVSLAAGDVLEISYRCYVNTYSMTEMDENWIRLKDFAASPLTAVNFAGAPEGAVITVMNGDDVIEARNGAYLLKADSYTYSVSAFGYKSIENVPFTVDGSKDSDTIAVSMEEMEKVTLTVKVLPEEAADAVVTVASMNGNVVTPETNGTYRVPKGETMKVSVSAKAYVDSVKYVVADSDQTVEITLVYCGIAWDGTTKTEPGKKNEIYQISNAEELAWFADQVASDAAISAELTANINLNNKTWTSFGKYDYSDANSGFAGTFDGCGYTISGLAGNGGLFECVAPNGVVKNLIVSGIVGGEANIGGIVNTLKGTVENCAYQGSVTNSNSYGATAAIAGRCLSGCVIRGCSSNAQVSNTTYSYASTLNVGGIAGYFYGTMENCYFSGSVSAREDRTTNKAIGGLTGQLYASGSISNSYVSGSVAGPAAGTGIITGISKGTISNVFALEGTSYALIADNSGSGTPEAISAERMSEGMFAYNLGAAFNQDTDYINGGYPVLKWQGGSEPSIPQFDQDVADDKAALDVSDAKRAAELAAEKAAVDAEVEAEGGLEAIRELYEDDTITMEYMYQLYEIDLSDDGTLTPGVDNKYQIRRDAQIVLASEGEKGSSITWKSSNSSVIDPNTGVVTLPAAGKEEVVLTAELSKGPAVDTKSFTFVVWSANAKDADLLETIRAKLEKKSTSIQPLQIYDQTNVTQTMEQFLGNCGYDVEALDGKGIKVEFLDPGTKVTPNDTKTYIDDQGNITYFTGTGTGYGTRSAMYSDVKMRLTLNEASTEVSVRVNIGWDVNYVDQMLQDVMDTVTWDTIKGENENTSTDQVKDGWMRTIVDGKLSGDLTLPYQLKDNSYVSIQWSSKTADALYVTDNNDGYTYNAALERPAKGSPDLTFTLIGTAKFNFWDEYTYEAYNSQGNQVEPTEIRKLFDLTIPANDEDQSETINAALDKYPGLIREFVDNTQVPDLNAVDTDLQMPRPSLLEDEGIFTDRYYQKVTMTSSNTDVLDFYGYHAMIYRPLPGEDDATVSYTIRISDRRNNATLGEKTFTMTVKALTQEEIDTAAAWMNSVCTDEVYWNGIKGENTSKDNVTSALNPFVEITNNNGELQYIRGAINITFGGAEADDLPGYDSMGTQNWRTFRSSRETIIASETLQLVKQPEYNTKVTIDSVLTYNEYGKYWEKFSGVEGYEQFEQFYKRPVSANIVVKGEKDMWDPADDKEITVTVDVLGNGFDNFADITGYKYVALANEDKTAWDALEASLIANGYTVEGGGFYVSAVTDAAGVTLSEKDHGKYSGWMYTVNDVAPEVSLDQTYINDQDKIVFYYTDGKSFEDQEAAQAVSDLINAIGDVTLDSKAAIDAARTAYDALTEDQKAYVTNLPTLTAAEETYAKLAQDAADHQAAADVEAQISALPAGDVLTLADSASVAAARTAYDALTETQKGYVSDTAKATLKAAEARIVELQAAADKEEADREAAAGVAAKIDAIPALDQLTLDDAQTVTDADNAYKSLTEDQQQYISEDQKAKLEDARNAMEELKAAAEKEKADREAAAAVDQMIEAIGDVTLNSKAAIDLAQNAYDALTEEQQAYVTKADVLAEAQAAYEALVKSENDKAAAAAVEARIDAIGEVTIDSRTAIEKAEAAYEALTDEQKQLVTNSDVLTVARAAYDSLVQVNEVEKQISLIGKVTTDSKAKIDAARTAYDALTADQQKQVGNYDVLQAAEAAYRDLLTGVKGFVNRLYQNILGRKADQAGFDSWVKVLTEGKEGGSETVANFVFSKEYESRKVSDEEFVTTLYRTILDRNPDQAGLDAWVSKLQTGMTRRYVVAGFTNSSEFAKLCKTYGIQVGSFTSNEIADQNDMATSFVSRLYTIVLGRKWDRAGLDAWTGQLVRHETGAGELSKGFFFSPEFTNRKLSNREFVTICYKTYLNREPDQAGLNAWVKLMNQGSSADEILNGFINSQEFGKLCASYGIEK